MKSNDETDTSRVLRCAMIHAPDRIYADTQTYGAKFMPIWAYTLSAHIPDDGRFVISLYDLRFEEESIIAEADVIMFTGNNQDFGNLERIRDVLKTRYPNAVTLIGGPICWSFDQAHTLDQLKNFDHLCVGDGEDMIAPILDNIYYDRPFDHIVRSVTRFDITRSKPFNRSLMDDTIGRYYGAVLEVSRGCPFLCEFCDIRVLQDNNRPHNKPIELIVSELDHLCRIGVKQVLIACDNFIGEPRWAEALMDAILQWQERTGFHPGMYTWLTINLYKFPRIMEKMRLAGFEMLFIGVESFNSKALRETAKVQNTMPEVPKVLHKIQSYGFIIVAGLIFGFDSDDETCFDVALQGLKESALLSGDPSLLTALPGTPLYRRMKMSGRLRNVRFGLGGYKYQTNIKYLMSRETIVNGYKKFVTNFVNGAYQYARLKGFFDLMEQGNFIPIKGESFGNLWMFVNMVIRNKAASWQMICRLSRFVSNPMYLYYCLKGLALVLSRRHIKGGFGYFQFWVFAWSNAVLKYRDVSDEDFNVEGVDASFDMRDILPEGYAETAEEDIPKQKIKAQIRATTAELSNIVAARTTGA